MWSTIISQMRHASRMRLNMCKKSTALKQFYSSKPQTQQIRNLKPYGKLKLKSKQKTMFVVQPVDPVQNPDQDQAFVQVSEPDRLRTSHTDDSIVTEDLHDNLQSQHEDLYCQHSLPLKYNIIAELKGEAALFVKSMESEKIQVNSAKGSCHLKSIKSDVIELDCGGPVLAESILHANGSIQTNQTMPVSLDKCLGTSLSIKTDEGNVSIGALYVDNCDIVTSRGLVSITACHRNTSVRICVEGNLSIGTLDGSLNADVNKGDVDIHISKIRKIKLNVNKGNVRLKLSDNLHCKVDLTADQVDIATDLQLENTAVSVKNGQQCVQGELSKIERGLIEEDNLLLVHCKEGTISLTKQDWFSSLGLGSLT